VHKKIAKIKNTHTKNKIKLQRSKTQKITKIKNTKNHKTQNQKNL